MSMAFRNDSSAYYPELDPGMQRESHYRRGESIDSRKLKIISRSCKYCVFKN